MTNIKRLVFWIDELCKLRAEQTIARDIMGNEPLSRELEALAAKPLYEIEQELDKLQHPASDKSKTIEG